MTGLYNFNDRDRRMIRMVTVIVILLVVFVLVSLNLVGDGYFFLPIGLLVAARIATLALYKYEAKPATEQSFFLPPRPSRFFFVKAGSIEGAPLRAPLYVGDILGFID